MDPFADGMIARGPTLGADRETWTGSLHIVDLPSVDSAQRFVEQEPYNRAGLFERHLVRRYDDLLGRTMWGAPQRPGVPLYLVIAQTQDDGEAPLAVTRRLTADQRVPLIIAGELRTLDVDTRVGSAWALQASTRDEVHDLLGEATTELEVEVLDWEFGGRR